MELKFFLPDENATFQMGQKLAGLIKAGLVIYLVGELGAGKTTLVRALLRALGYTDSVKSPTYTLVEEYTFKDFELYHFDLYRIKNSDELLNFGFEEYFRPNTVCLIEWPELARNFGEADLECHLKLAESGRELSLLTQNKILEAGLSSWKE